VVGERLTALLEARLRQRDKLQTERSGRFAPLAHSLVESEDELPVITMLLDDYYQQLLHAPAVKPDSAPATVQPRQAPRPDRDRRPRSGRRR
jgi:ATP-dependent RNA helicase DeaD